MTRPRILVLDVMLPKLSGFDVLKQIRTNRQTQDLPVLVLTAKGQQQDRRIAEELGADMFVTKPYSNTDVVDAVRRLLDVKRSEERRVGKECRSRWSCYP